MNPSEEYKNLAMFTIDYLALYLESYIGALNLGIELSEHDLTSVEILVAEETLENNSVK